MPTSYRDHLSLWADSPGLGKSPEGAWSIAGELDSPIPAERLRAVRSRRPASLDELLFERTAPGDLVVLSVGTRSHAGPRLIADLARRHRDGAGPLPVWIRSWNLDLSLEPDAALSRYLAASFGSDELPACSHGRLLILEHPDLARFGPRPADGLLARGALRRWRDAFPEDRLLVLVHRDTFIAHDPYPGWFGFSSPELSDAAGSELREESAAAGFLPPGEPPAKLLEPAIEALRGDAGDEDALLAALYRLLELEVPGRSLSETFLPLGSLGASAAGRVREALRSLILDLDADRGLLRDISRSPRRDARVGGRVYCLLHALSPEDHLKTTFTDLDLGSWLCFLRSFGYEQLAVVAARLAREDLAGVNLMHAPPLAFGDLHGADFRGADLYRVDFSWADLREVRFVDADLSRSHLKGADLRGADLSGADVSYASIELADLRGADLAGANLDRSFDEYARRE